MSTLLSDFDGLLDWPNIQEWLKGQHVPGSGPVTAVERLTGGSQNNIFRCTRQGGSFVLRRPPRHLRDNSNDTMLREARVLGALAGSSVPHPALLAVCPDVSVTNAVFYLMAPLDGFTPLGALPANYATDPGWRRAMGTELVAAASALGRVDHVAVGLSDFGKPDNWHQRQVARWRSQLDGYRDMPGYPGEALPKVDAIGVWLQKHCPAIGKIGIIHGDLQFANVMFRRGAPTLAGLIDWELSTLGDPLLDLGWILTSWTEPDDPAVGGRTPAVTPWTGFMTRAELVAMYGRLSGRDMTDMPWYFVLACFKLACLLEGTYARACGGKAPMEMGQYLHNYALWLLAKADQLIAQN